MLSLQVIGSSSKGNCYILHCDTHCLIIEAGCPLRAVRKALNFDTASIEGLIVSHRHGDHAKYLHEYVAAGIPCYVNEDTLQHKHDLKYGLTVIEPRMRVHISSFFSVLAISVDHDVPCYAYLIRTPDGSCMFVTDTVNLPVGVHCSYLFLEANYADDILTANAESGEVTENQRKRIILSHMELGTTKLIAANYAKYYLRQPSTIVLLHLSDRNSDEHRFVKEVKAVTGIPVYAAAPGRHIILK